MPYIKQVQRDLLDPTIESLSNRIDTIGELNYAITRLCFLFLQQSHIEISYAELNNIVGVLECAKQEFYRRIVSKYEDLKIVENRDVYI